jgi:glucose/arabinose dehydrogenase
LHKVARGGRSLVPAFALCLGAVGLALASAPLSVRVAAQTPSDWRSEWAVEEGFAIDVDAQGFSFPTAIAFVPRPGPEPSDPLYFVTELRGRIRVVTNDRSVHTFAEDFFRSTPRGELPQEAGETGLAGLCLAPEHGYVFVTYAYHDAEGVLRNDMARFDTRPGTFALTPTARTAFTDLFVRDPSTISHQIGGCQVAGETLFVSVGDGMQRFQSRQLDSTLGKVLRMSLDGRPLADNPFRIDDDPLKARNFVWASGFRNPFSLKVVGGRLFVGDNGLAVDRFVEVRPGEDYLWDGTDWSIALNSAVVFVPSPAPVQIDFLAEGTGLFPEIHEDRFYIAMSGLPSQRGQPDRPGAKGVVTVSYDLRTGRVREVPASFLRYRGSGYQSVVGLAFGPDGLYVLPLFPDPRGESVVLRISHAPERAHPHYVTDLSAERLVDVRGCYGCHSLGTMRRSDVGPPLDRDLLVGRLEERLLSPAYTEHLRALDAETAAPIEAGREARREVAAAEGMARIRTWLRHKVQDPRFDNPGAVMPDVGLSPGEASAITDFLLAGGAPAEAPSLKAFIRDRLPEPGHRTTLFAFSLGFALPLLALALLVVARRRWMR